MASKWCIALFIALAVAHQVTARNVPAASKDAAAGLDDQKNFMTYGGMGGYSGVGNNGFLFLRMRVGDRFKSPHVEVFDSTES
uniref:Uncharacterized protein n=1 Tax=Cannabis sativa TaxID=3483 RepID=A0A803PGB8_CANSA